MRAWKNLAAPDDPTAWYDVNNMMPTPRGSYMTIPPTLGTARTATGAGTVIIGFMADTLSSYVEWVFDSSKIWYFDGVSTYTDRTNSVAIGSNPFPIQYGNITICAMGVGNATVASTSGGNFAALAGAPQAEILAVCRGAVLAFNTNTSTDGWAASDVGDHTNWTTGESASGRLLDTPGPIRAAITLDDSVYVFKGRGVYRGWYTGNAVKWAWDLINPDIGVAPGTGSPVTAKYGIAASDSLILFTARGNAISGLRVCAMNSSGQYRVVNPETSVTNSAYMIRYVSEFSCFTMVSMALTPNVAYIYSPQSDALGYASAPYHATDQAMPTMGHSNGNAFMQHPLGIGHRKTAANELTRYLHDETDATYAARSCYLQTAMVGSMQKKIRVTRLIPLVRRRTDKGTDSAALSVTMYRDISDTSAARTEAVTESTTRKWFDFNLSDNFARFKVTWTAIDAEVDDFEFQGSGAGSN